MLIKTMKPPMTQGERQSTADPTALTCQGDQDGHGHDLPDGKAW
jgi:hypothetical protein